MGTYRIAATHGIAFVSMTVLTTIVRNDPRTIGIQYPERVTSISSADFVDGSPFTEWEFKAMLMSDFAAFVSANGLTFPTTLTAPVTIYTLKHLTTYARYNATAHLAMTNDGYSRVPDPRSLMDVVFRYTDLVAL